MLGGTKGQEITMTVAAAALSNIRRPKILIRAARAGVSDYHRNRDLRRLLRLTKAARDVGALHTLLAEEERLEGKRTAGEATYSIQRHVAILTALIAEARKVPTLLH
jgi:acetylornithine/succinyldiaminopimelate/putrescine aminotransferase